MIALITGASSGIGLEMSKSLAKRGFNLILVARRKEKLLNLKKEIVSEYGVRVKVICKDLSDVNACMELHKEVSAVRIDLLINNAGFGLFGKFWETDLDRELEMIDVNVKALHILTKLFLRDFTERDYGFILNVSSVAGFMPGPNMATYYATKNYVLQLTSAIYEELRSAGKNVYVGAFCPGPVNTEFNEISGANFGNHGLSAADAAEYAIEKMFDGKLIIIPENEMKLIAFASGVSPRKITMRILGQIQKLRAEYNEISGEIIDS